MREKKGASFAVRGNCPFPKKVDGKEETTEIFCSSCGDENQKQAKGEKIMSKGNGNGGREKVYAFYRQVGFQAAFQYPLTKLSGLENQENYLVLSGGSMLAFPPQISLDINQIKKDGLELKINEIKPRFWKVPPNEVKDKISLTGGWESP